MADETTVVELSSLSFTGDPSKYPSNKEVPLGAIEFEIKEWQAFRTNPVTDPDKLAKGNKGGKLAFKCLLSVSQPEEFKGFLYRHDFYIGANDDTGFDDNGQPKPLKES